MSTRTTFFFTLRYRDARRAYAWLSDAFGFEPGVIYPESGDRVDHAEMYFGSGGIMFGQSSGISTPGVAADATDRPGVYAVVEDIDAHFGRARAAGAEITRELRDTDYGSREYTALDFEGNPWSFGTYLPERPESTS
jgi:uncharacterized glyoxalase superfamily protein PhnB